MKRGRFAEIADLMNYASFFVYQLKIFAFVLSGIDDYRPPKGGRHGTYNTALHHGAIM
jgi:hypothetical protein